MKTSFITTVYNEERNIEKFLNSIIKQSKKPNEIIVVDGGSSDKTIDIIKKIKKKTKIPFKLIIKPGANIAKGRNIAVKETKYNLIFVSDAGCIINKDWIKETLKYFPKAEVVAGNYKAIAKNNFEFFQGILTVNKVDRITRMSSRNLAFKKECWKKVKGYPEEYLTGEDTRFNLKMKKRGCKFKINPRKDVAWEMRPTFKLFFKQFYKYGQGDKIQRNLIKLKKNLLMILGFWAYLVFLIGSLFLEKYLFVGLTLFPIICLFLKSFKIFIRTNKILSFCYVPLLEGIKKLAYIMGATFG